jgi:hypothetical protein
MSGGFAVTADSFVLKMQRIGTSTFDGLFKPMKRFLCTSVVAALLLVGCSRLTAPNPPSGLPLLYHNAQYGLIFFLPASWRGYTVLVQRWDGQTYSAAADKTIVTEHGPVIVLRHPQWKAGDPCQDIPILVFTRRQWDADKQGRFSIGAGGMEYEIGHNPKYTFAIHSRFNWGESRGWKEAGAIVERNQAAGAPHLYPE